MKRINIILVFLLPCLLFIGCKNGNGNEPKPENNINNTEIIGKWKLEKVDAPFVAQSFDYSQYNIVYEFKSNGVLTVSSETDIIDEYIGDEIYIGHGIGEHSYSFVENKEGYLWVDYPYRLVIDRCTYPYWYLISSDELEISASPVDGFVYYLVKLK